MTIIEAIEDFRESAIAKADGAKPASKDHELHARMTRAFVCLTSHGENGIAAFTELLQDESSHVRIWVAAQFLAEGCRSAIPIMEQLATQPGIQGFSAAMTLKEFHSGCLRSPFTTSVV
ncbi:MAG: hypothetical protein U1A53_02785 [Prosthecobacter sp.]|nr:hypothetical protein [Prosthecobacter sp.]